jgi:hypothetical protein
MQPTIGAHRFCLTNLDARAACGWGPKKVPGTIDLPHDRKMYRESFLGKWPAAVGNVLKRKSLHGVITIDKREVVLPLQRLVKPCRVLDRD